MQEGWLEYTKLRYRPTKALRDFIQHQKDTMYVAEGQTPMARYSAMVDAMPPNARDAISTVAQGRKRTTRSSLGGAPAHERQLSQEQEAEVGRAISAKRRRTRLTEPGVRLIQPPTNRRSTISKAPRRITNRRHTLPVNAISSAVFNSRNSAADESVVFQFKPLGQVLTERTRRAIRRNMLSEEQLELERDARSNRAKSKLELERVRKLLAESNAQLARLQQQLESIRAAPSEVASMGMAPIYEDGGDGVFVRDPSPFRRRMTMSPGVFAGAPRLQPSTPGFRRKDHKIMELQKQIEVLEAAIKEHEMEREEYEVFHDAEEGDSYMDESQMQSPIVDFSEHRNNTYTPPPLSESHAASPEAPSAYSPEPHDNFDDASNFDEPMLLNDEDQTYGHMYVDSGSQTVEDEHVLAKLRDSKSLADELSRKLLHTEAQYENALTEITKLKEDLQASKEKEMEVRTAADSEIQGLQAAKDGVQEQLDALQKTSEIVGAELKSEMEKLIEIVEDLKNQKSQLEEKLATTEEESRSEIDELQNKIDAIEKEAESGVERLEAELEQKNAEIEELEESAAELSDKNQALNSELETLEKKLENALETVDDKESELISTRNEIYEINEQFDLEKEKFDDQLARLNKEHDDAIHERDSEMDVLETALHENQESLAEKEAELGEARRELATKELEMAEMERELMALRISAMKASSSNVFLQEENEASMQTAAILQNLIDDLQHQLDTESTHSAKLQQRIKEVTLREEASLSTRRSLDIEISKLSTDLDLEKKRTQRLTDSVNSLESKQRALTSEKIEVEKRLIDQKDEFSRQLKSKDQFLEELTISKDRQISASTLKAADLESKVQQLKESLRLSQESLSIEQEQSTRFSAKISLLEGNVAELRSESDNRGAKIAQLKEKLAAHDNTILDLTAKNDELQQALDDAESQIADLKFSLTDKDTELSVLEETQERLRATMDEERNRFNATNEDLSVTISSFNEEVSRKSVQIEDLQSQVQELMEQLSNSQAEAEMESTRLQKDLDELHSSSMQEIERLKEQLSRMEVSTQDLDDKLSSTGKELLQFKADKKNLGLKNTELEGKLQITEASLADALSTAADAEAKFQATISKLKSELEDRKSDLVVQQRENANEVARLRSKHTEDIEALQRSFEERSARLRSEHSTELNSVLRNANEERQKLVRNFDEERLQTQAMHEEELAELEEKHEAEVAAVINKFKNEATQGINEMMRNLGQAMLVQAKRDVARVPTRGSRTSKRARMDEEDMEEDETSTEYSADLTGALDHLDVLTPPSSNIGFGEHQDVKKLKQSTKRVRDSGIGME